MTNKHQMFSERYNDNETPWDTGIVPPEIIAIIDELPTGRALDLGCGTGTVVRYLIDQGWQADGVDFVQTAIDRAREKFTDVPDKQYRIMCHDVTRLDTLSDLRPPYDLLIDIGCGHGIDKAQNDKYARDLANLIRSDGTFMLYIHQPREDSDMGWSPEDVRRLFVPNFEIVSEIFSEDTSIQLPSVWYRLRRH